MKLPIKTEIDVKEFATLLARQSGVEQSAFFNTFFQEVRKGCETDYLTNSQLQAIGGKLSMDAMQSLEIMFFTEED